MVVKPSPPKHKTEISDEKLIISMPSKKIFPFIIVFGVWSLIWLSVEIGLVAEIFITQEYNFLGVLFFIFWFILWNLLGAFLLYNLMWQLVGKEEIQVTNGSITISQVIIGYKRSKEYLAEHIKDLDVAWASMDDLTFRRISVPLGANYGMIAFDYGARTFRFAGVVEAAEAKQIIAEIKQKYPQYKNQES